MAQKLHVAVNDYAWKTFYQREGREMTAHLDQALGEIAGLGFAGYEPNVLSLEMLQDLAPRLQSHHLALRSIYVNSPLHFAHFSLTLFLPFFICTPFDPRCQQPQRAYRLPPSARAGVGFG